MLTNTERRSAGIWTAVAVLAGVSTIVRCGSEPLMALTYAALTGLALLQILDATR